MLTVGEEDLRKGKIQPAQSIDLFHKCDAHVIDPSCDYGNRCILQTRSQFLSICSNFVHVSVSDECCCQCNYATSVQPSRVDPI